MRCPKCSYISFDDQVACVKCKLQLDGKNALPFQGTGIRVESFLYLRTQPVDEEPVPAFEPVVEEQQEDPTADLYQQLAVEGMGAGLGDPGAELELSLADAGVEDGSLLFENLPQPAEAGSSDEPAFELQAEEEVPTLELQAEEEVLSLEEPGEGIPSLEPVPQEAASLELSGDESGSLEFEPEDEDDVDSLFLQPEEEVGSLEPQLGEAPPSFALAAEEDRSLAPPGGDDSMLLQFDEEAPAEDFSDFRPAIDDGEPESGAAAAPAAMTGAVMAPAAAEEEEMDLFQLEPEENLGPFESPSPASNRSPGDSIFDLSDLMGGESTSPAAEGPTLADNADMLLDLTFDGGAGGGNEEPGYDSRLTEEDELDLGLDLDDDDQKGN